MSREGKLMTAAERERQPEDWHGRWRGYAMRWLTLEELQRLARRMALEAAAHWPKRGERR